MSETRTGGRGVRFLTTTGWFVIVVAGMRAAESILVPLLLSLFIALLCAPPLLWMERKGVPTALAVSLLILAVILAGLMVGAIAGSSLSDFSVAVPHYQEQLKTQLHSVLKLVQDIGVKVSPEELLAYVDPGAAVRLGATMLTGLGEMLTNSFLILLTVTFILFEASTFPQKLAAIWEDGKAPFGRLGKFSENVYRFLAIKTLVSIATGVVVTIWLAVLGVDFPLLWGLLAFLLNYIPSLGSIIAAGPPVVLGFIQFGVGSALLVGLGFLVINVLFGTLLEPRLMGQRLGLSTLAVFLSLVFWGWVLGPVGMILCVPLTMIAKIALESSEDTRWISVLLGPAQAAVEVSLAPSASRSPGRHGGDAGTAPPT